MKAMVLKEVVQLADNVAPLCLQQVDDPVPGAGEILIRVSACGVCHTELDEIEGRTPPPRFPVILGHEVVGRVLRGGEGAGRFAPGDRVGVAWIYSACQRCKFCRSGRENLCAEFLATGRDADGGYAEQMIVPEQFAYPLPASFSDSQAAPLLCAGAIGYRSLRLSGIEDGQTLGLTGFGASGHLVLKLVQHRYPNTKVFVFARSPGEQEFARQLGAAWAGDTEQSSPDKLDAIIDTTPVYKPVVEALRNLERGGRLVINAIRKEAVDQEYLLRLDYPTHLWMEKEIKSVANVTRADVREFLDLAAQIGLRPEFEEYSLTEANRALLELKQSKIRGAKVLMLGG
jgi:propanol-preferring alcohol dehydrogenase